MVTRCKSPKLYRQRCHWLVLLSPCQPRLAMRLALALGSAAFGIAAWAGGAVLLRTLKRLRPAPLFAIGAALGPATVVAAGALLGVSGAERDQALACACGVAAAVDAVVMATPPLRRALYDTDGDAVTVKQCAALLWAIGAVLLASCVMT